MITYILIYLCAVNLLAVALTVCDKYKAKRNRWRISENALMTVGLLGGALCELITMKLIRHKTKHKKFMIGLPAEILLHIAIFILIYLKTAQLI